MIDKSMLRTAEKLQKIIESEKKRYKDTSNIEALGRHETRRLKLQYELEMQSCQINKNNDRLKHFCGNFKDEEAKSLLENNKQLKEQRKLMCLELNEVENLVEKGIKSIGNLVDESVTVSKNEEDAPVLRDWWAVELKKEELNNLKENASRLENLKIEKQQCVIEIEKKIIYDGENINSDAENENLNYDAENEVELLLRRNILKNKKILHFSEVCARLDGVDSQRGVRLVGHRGYLMKGDLLLLKDALMSYAVEFGIKRGYLAIQPPVMLLEAEMKKVAQLQDYAEQLYSVEGGLFLVATAEQPLVVMHSGEKFTKSELPLRYVGKSSCFRKEAGASGRDCRGIFRIHEFEKVEQIVLCEAENSNLIYEEMIGLSESFYRSLGISYRVIGIVSGDLNDAAALKCDLEGFFPHEGVFRELVSCSNCTDYQSRAANIRVGSEYVHILNSTLCAIQRTLCCLVENYQTENGVVVPLVLRKILGKKFIPFKN